MLTINEILSGGAVAVFLLVFTGAVRGDLRFRPGIDGQLKAKDEHIAYLTAQVDRLTKSVEQLAEALEARNRRDERVRRES